MILRKSVNLNPSGNVGISLGPSTAVHAKPSQRNRLGAVIFVALVGFFMILILLSKKAPAVPVVPADNGPFNVLRNPLVAKETTSPTFESLDNCELVKDLLDGKIPSSREGLPSSGKETSFGAVFWLKSPVLKARLPDKNVDVVLLKYNKYLPKQHTLKWTNTVSILNRYRDGRVFPKMYGYCRDPGDGFHYIVVEWIDLHPSELPKSANFEGCFDRMDTLMNMLVILDEEMHLTFMDVKKGQWMSRQDQKSFVLQDVDDIVASPWTPTKEAGDLYEDQVGSAQQIVQGHMGGKKAIGYVKKLWDEQFFPEGYTIRYTMILLGEIIQHDMGFNWERDCRNGMPPGFMQCFKHVLKWAATQESNWPAPKQVRWALNECKSKGIFSTDDPQAKRPPAPWRDPTKQSISEGKSYISCYRAYQKNIKKTDPAYTENIFRCKMSENGEMQTASKNDTNYTCCRANGNDPCYYFVSARDLCR